jgi:hypothetical protein
MFTVRWNAWWRLPIVALERITNGYFRWGDAGAWRSQQ